MYYNNAYYARVGGITNSEVNSLEMELLRMICTKATFTHSVRMAMQCWKRALAIGMLASRA